MKGGFSHDLLTVAAALQNKFNGLNTRKLPNYPSPKPALPVVLFVCSGRPPTAGAAAPPFVVTTSTDHWEWCVPWQDVVKKLHREKDRPEMAPLSTGDGFNVGKLSNDAEADFVNPAKVPNGTLEERKAAIAKWRQDKGNWRDHSLEHARPFLCPSFETLARCARCQHLFEYEVGNEVRAKEENLLKMNVPPFNQGWLCAETYAHFYCLAAQH
jgi:hypothetical protein